MTTKKHQYIDFGLPSDISREALDKLPRPRFEGEIVVIDKIEHLDKGLSLLSGSPIIGIDTETKPNFNPGKQNSVSLLQLSTETHCLLIRIGRIGLPTSITQILEDESILKVGLSLQGDIRQLLKLNSFEPRGFIELQQLAPGYGLRCSSLQKMYAIVCGGYLSKKQRLSNWEAQQLSEAQQQYATLDAYACLKIYQHFMSLPAPHPNQFALLTL